MEFVRRALARKRKFPRGSCVHTDPLPLGVLVICHNLRSNAHPNATASRDCCSLVSLGLVFMGCCCVHTVPNCFGIEVRTLK
eukprot:2608949-Amphidinium_carterae.1